MLQTLLVFLAFGAPVEAASFAEVDAIWAPDAAGVWRRVERSGAALRVKEGGEEVLSVGFDLDEGDRIRTTQARVRLRLKKGQMVVRPESDVRIQADGVLQKVGEVFYSVEGNFRVQYRGVEAAVEGTQFTVGGDEAGVHVAVGEGRVRVAAEGESVLVGAGEVTRVAFGSNPLAPTLLEGVSKKGYLGLRKQLGLPSASVAVLGSGGLNASDFLGALRLQGRLRLSPGLRLVAETGVRGDGESFSLQESVGLENRFGPMGIALTADLALGEKRHCDGTVEPLGVRVGASSTLRVRIPLPHNWGLENQVRIAYDGEPSAEVGWGVSLGL